MYFNVLYYLSAFTKFLISQEHKQTFFFFGKFYGPIEYTHYTTIVIISNTQMLFN